MIAPPMSTRIWLAAGATDMRKGFDGLASLAQQKLERDPHSGQVFVRRCARTNGACASLRGKRGDLIKVIWWDGQGMCLFSKRLERGRFVWPSPKDGIAHLTPAQLAMLLEGIDWRMPKRTTSTQIRRPEAAG